MRTLGLLGGTSWESTAVYYAWLNRATAEALGPGRQPPLLLHSFDFAAVAELQDAGDWTELAARYAAATRALVSGGAQVLGICANTMHLVADEVAHAGAGAELVHVVDAVAAAAHASGAGTVALLGTSFTMEKPFYADGLTARGLQVVVPGAALRAALHTIIVEELVRGVVRPSSRQTLLEIVADCAGRGAQVALLACTELGMLAQPGDPEAVLPLVDSAVEHCRALLAAALADPALPRPGAGPAGGAGPA